MKTGALLAVVAVSMTAGAGTSAAPGQSSPRTLLTTRGTIVSFAQDGPELAWVERPGGKRCRRILHIRPLGKGHDTTARIGCGRTYDDLALAGTRVLWKHLAGATSLTRAIDVMTMAAGERRPSPLEEVDVDFDPLDCRRLELTCRPQPEPVLAGKGGLLAYSTPTGVRRVVRDAHGAFLAFPDARKLVVSGGRVLALRSELRPGDGCGCASAPAWLPDGSIEYLAKGELARVNGDGTDRRVMTHDGLSRFNLAVSHDGTKIAYDHLNPADISTRLVAVAAADGSSAHDVGAGMDPTWSPDGSRLAVSRGPFGSRQIYVMDANGADVTELTQGAESTQPAWSPDGSKIAYISNGGIWVMRPDGSDAHSLGVAAPVYAAPDWSPDTSRLVFSGTAGLSVANADGSNVQLLPAAGATPRWSPDGDWIVFQSATQWWDVDSRYELSLIHPDGSGLRPLTFSVAGGWASPAVVADARGRVVARFEVPGTAFDAALGAQTSVLAKDAGPRKTSALLFDTATGSPRGSLVLTQNTFAPQLVGISGRWLVFHVERTISGLDLTSGRHRTFAVAKTPPVGLSLSGNRLAWGENPGGHGRIRALTVPR